MTFGKYEIIIRVQEIISRNYEIIFRKSEIKATVKIKVQEVT